MTENLILKQKLKIKEPQIHFVGHKNDLTKLAISIRGNEKNLGVD